MGPPKTIKIRIAPDGSSTVEAVNFRGTGCKAATQPYETALGIVKTDVDKPEIRLTGAETGVRRNTTSGT